MRSCREALSRNACKSRYSGQGFQALGFSLNDEADTFVRLINQMIFRVQVGLIFDKGVGQCAIQVLGLQQLEG